MLCLGAILLGGGCYASAVVVGGIVGGTAAGAGMGAVVARSVASATPMPKAEAPKPAPAEWEAEAPKPAPSEWRDLDAADAAARVVQP